MTVILDQFIHTLVESGLMTAEEIDAFVDGFPRADRPTDGEGLARLLFGRKKLTKFQIQCVYQGKTKGLVVGNYLVLDKIGQGGMGHVYKAQHKRMKRVVALKVLPSAMTDTPDAVLRFGREVEVAARLEHPNIVTAFDADEADGVHFLVMQYVKGSDLAVLVRKKGTLSVAKALDYLIQAGRGLDYAHAQGVIHRDIKPANLLLDEKGVVKILDMGLARLEQELDPEGSTATAKKHQAAWADHLGEPVEEEIDLGDGLKLTMTLIPPGEFVMGSTAEERTSFLEETKWAANTKLIVQIQSEGPRHRVRITRSFRLGRHEVTRGQFRRFVSAGLPNQQLGLPCSHSQVGCVKRTSWIPRPNRRMVRCTHPTRSSVGYATV